MTIRTVLSAETLLVISTGTTERPFSVQLASAPSNEATSATRELSLVMGR